MGRIPIHREPWRAEWVEDENDRTSPPIPIDDREAGEEFQRPITAPNTSIIGEFPMRAGGLPIIALQVGGRCHHCGTSNKSGLTYLKCGGVWNVFPDIYVAENLSDYSK